MFISTASAIETQAFALVCFLGLGFLVNEVARLRGGRRRTAPLLAEAKPQAIANHGTTTRGTPFGGQVTEEEMRPMAEYIRWLRQPPAASARPTERHRAR